MPRKRKVNDTPNHLPQSKNVICPNCGKRFRSLNSHFHKNPMCLRASTRMNTDTADPSFMFRIHTVNKSNNKQPHDTEEQKNSLTLT